MTTEHIPAPVLSATCPLCHTLDRTVTPESLLSGAYWSCARCGQKWTAARLETASAYQRDLAAPIGVKVLARSGRRKPHAEATRMVAVHRRPCWRCR